MSFLFITPVDDKSLELILALLKQMETNAQEAHAFRRRSQENRSRSTCQVGKDQSEEERRVSSAHKPKASLLRADVVP